MQALGASHGINYKTEDFVEVVTQHTSAVKLSVSASTSKACKHGLRLQLPTASQRKTLLWSKRNASKQDWCPHVQGVPGGAKNIPGVNVILDLVSPACRVHGAMARADGDSSLVLCTHRQVALRASDCRWVPVTLPATSRR